MPQKWPLFSSKHLAPSSGTAIIDRAPAGVATSAFVPDSIERPQTVFSPTAYAIIASRQELHQAGLPRRILNNRRGLKPAARIRDVDHGFDVAGSRILPP